MKLLLTGATLGNVLWAMYHAWKGDYTRAAYGMSCAAVTLLVLGGMS